MPHSPACVQVLRLTAGCACIGDADRLEHQHILWAVIRIAASRAPIFIYAAYRCQDAAEFVHHVCKNECKVWQHLPRAQWEAHDTDCCPVCDEPRFHEVHSSSGRRVLKPHKVSLPWSPTITRAWQHLAPVAPYEHPLAGHAGLQDRLVALRSVPMATMWQQMCSCVACCGQSEQHVYGTGKGRYAASQYMPQPLMSNSSCTTCRSSCTFR